MLEWWLPGPVSASTFGPSIDRLFYVIYYVTGITFILVQGALLAFVVLYRERPGRRATYTHGNTTLEIIWTVTPAVLLVVMGIVSRSVWAEIKEHVPASEFNIEITAKQFNWEIAYAGPDGTFGTTDDVLMDNDFHVPVNRTVRILLKSRDVIHSLFIPDLRFKQDAVPGHEIPVWFKVTRPGTYEMPCAELCGFGHSGMKGSLFVEEQAAYDAWAAEHKVGPMKAAPASGVVAGGEQGS